MKLEELLELAGFAVWPQIEHEADDGLASAAAVAAGDPRVEQVVICTPDKDLAQCVTADGRIGAVRPAPAGALRPRRGGGEVRCAPGLDTRLPGLGGRLRRRFPGPARLGRQVGVHPAGPVRPHHRHPVRPRPVGRAGAGARPSSRPRCGTASRTRCSSAGSPPWSWAPRCRPPSTRWNGGDRGPAWKSAAPNLGPSASRPEPGNSPLRRNWQWGVPIWAFVGCQFVAGGCSWLNWQWWVPIWASWAASSRLAGVRPRGLR